VHFIGLVNVANLKPGGLGTLGDEQLDWLKKDVADLGERAPIIVYAHVPLWTVYAKWGWGTADAAQALGLLKRFGSATVLNGHIHQTMKKGRGERNVSHSTIDGFSSRGAGQSRVARSHQERGRRQTLQRAGPDEHEVY
jgi:3',5'-cyclic AMP phosphodiesterase CpdA